MKRADRLWLFLLSLSFYLSHNVRHQPSLPNFYSAFILFIPPHVLPSHRHLLFFLSVMFSSAPPLWSHSILFLSFFLTLSFHLLVFVLHTFFCAVSVLPVENKSQWVRSLDKMDVFGSGCGCLCRWLWGPRAKTPAWLISCLLSILNSAENTTARRARRAREPR